LDAEMTYQSVKCLLCPWSSSWLFGLYQNGNHVFSSFSGTIVFNNKLHLTNVLYVPQFAFNLISASKIILTLNCSLIFSSAHCLIQDNQTKERIGLVYAKDGI